MWHQCKPQKIHQRTRVFLLSLINLFLWPHIRIVMRQKNKTEQLHVLSCADKTKTAFGEGADCGEKAGARTGTSILVITAHRCLGFQIFSVWGIKWLHWRQGSTHILISPCANNWTLSVLMLHLKTFSSSPLSFFSYFTSFLARGWPAGGKCVTPLLSLDTIAFDTRWWERERKGAHCTFSRDLVSWGLSTSSPKMDDAIDG